MKGDLALAKKVLGKMALLILVCVLAVAARAAVTPLSQDDVLLLLLGGASTEKMVALIEQRGIDFRMNPDLAKRFHDAGADDMVIEALQKAGGNVKATPSAPKQLPATGEQPPAPTYSPLDREVALPDALDPNQHPLAPTFSLVDLSGQKLHLADYKGKVVMLSFWATWCGRCRIAIPQFVELQDRYRDQGFRVIGISVDESSKPVREFYRAYNMNYPVAMGDRKIVENYGGIAGVPTTFLIGRDGRIYAARVGIPQDGDVSSFLEGEIKMLLAAKAEGGGEAAGVDQAGRSASAGAASTTTASSAPKTETAPPGGLPDPGPEKIQEIIREFTAKEKLFKEARNNYTYHQINKVSEFDADGSVVGTYHQEWDILYDDRGQRIERVTYAPQDTLKRIGITPEDLESMRKVQPFVLTTDELPVYDVKYLGHVKVDEITAYVFSIRPKEIQKGRIYFQGTVWVDDRDLQIVKSEGKTVPEMKTKKGENLFPRFSTYREQIDGKYWFPTYTMADDTLYFASGPVHIKQTIRYTDYKQFKAKVRILSTSPTDRPTLPAGNPPPDQK